MKLRPYQTEAIDGTYQQLSQYASTLLVMATGTGKTVTFAHIANAYLKYGRVMMLAHREELIHQGYQKLHLITGKEPDVEMGDYHSVQHGVFRSPIVVSTIQTQISGMGGEGRMTKFNPDEFSLLIIDECFPAGTLIDGRPIETIRVGDIVNSFNHTSNRVEDRRVMKLSRRRTDALAVVTLANGKKIICTPNHPIFTLRGYIPAGILTCNDMVITTIDTERDKDEAEDLCCLRDRVHPEELELLHGSDMLGEVQTCTAEGESQEGSSELLNLRPGSCARRTERLGSSEKGTHPLLAGMQVGTFTEDNSDNLCQARRTNHKVPKNQWNESPRSPSTGIDKVEGDGLEATTAWGQRRIHGSATITGLCAGLADGSGDPDTILEERQSPESVQGGYREFGHENSDRGGWQQPQDDQREGAGFEEGFGLAAIRVEGVEILEQGHSGRFEQLCPDGIVYNLEVDSNHNYFADGILVHNCHHATANSYRRIINYFRQNPELKVLGVTATPDRADEEALGQIFESVAFEYGIREGIGDGWLVPIRQRPVYVNGLDYSGIKTTAGDLNGGELAAEMEREENLHPIVNHTLEYVGDRKTLVFAASVAHAERLTEIFNRPANKPNCARFVTGTTDKDQRREMFKDFAAKRFQILVNVGVATEGFDDPGIECVILGRPTKSRSLFAQMCGRGTRPLPGLVDGVEDAEARRKAIVDSGKPFLEVIDFVGNAGRHKLISMADILGGNYSDEIVELAKKSTQEKSKEGKAVDMMSELELAEQQIRREHQKSADAERRKKIIIRSTASSALINPFDVFDVEPCREKAWHKGRPPTPKQLEMLEKSGVDPAGLSFTHASQLIQQIVDRRQNDLCTFKQAKVLRKYGFEADKATFTEAKRIIDELAANGWRRPA
jgi:superfamily II DNA or RNA helicase